MLDRTNMQISQSGLCQRGNWWKEILTRDIPVKEILTRDIPVKEILTKDLFARKDEAIESPADLVAQLYAKLKDEADEVTRLMNELEMQIESKK